jgi:RES domain-containing protein
MAGARLYGGRWNRPGASVVYVAESQSPAVLEVLVHLDTPALQRKCVLLEVEFDASLVVDLDRSSLPENWQSDPVPEAIQAIGDRWILSGDSAVLRVPSVLVPEESNLLLNPRHPDFWKIAVSRPQASRFDPRLARRQ